MIFQYQNAKGIESYINTLIESLSAVQFQKPDALPTDLPLPFFSTLLGIVEKSSEMNNGEKPMFYQDGIDYEFSNPDDKNSVIGFFWNHDANSDASNQGLVYDLSFIVWFYEGLFSNKKRLHYNISEYLFSKIFAKDPSVSNLRIVGRDENWDLFEGEVRYFQDAPYNAVRLRFNLHVTPYCEDIINFGLTLKC